MDLRSPEIICFIAVSVMGTELYETTALQGYGHVVRSGV